MALSEFEIKRYELILDEYVESIRPPEEIRAQLDISYRIEDQSIFVSEIRPQYNNKSVKKTIDVMKATFIKKQNQWKIFWMRADLKWHGYQPDLYKDNLEDVISVLEKDEYGCFWG